MFEALLQDLVFAVRLWRVRPVLAVVIVLTLALGFSATSVMVSVVQTVLLEPLPYSDPSRLVVVRAGLPGQRRAVAQLSGPEVVALKDRARRGTSLRVSDKGGVSVYGLGRFPVTLYKEQWLKLLAMADEIRAFIRDNAARLKTKT